MRPLDKITTFAQLCEPRHDAFEDGECIELDIWQLPRSASFCLAMPFGRITANHRFSLMFDGVKFDIDMVQAIGRHICIKADKSISGWYMWSVFMCLRDVLMLVDGFFLETSNAVFYKEGSKKKYLYANKYMAESSAVFASFENLGGSSVGILSGTCPDIHLDMAQMLLQWMSVEKELRLPFMLVLYYVSALSLPVDLRIGHLVEFSEVLVEFISETGIYQLNMNGIKKKGRLRLRDCLEILLKNFGQIVFDDVLNGNITRFIDVCVHSRNKIMHIKRESKTGDCWDCWESCLLVNRFWYLYRRILLELIGVKFEEYNMSLCKIVQRWDEQIDFIVSEYPKDTVMQNWKAVVQKV